MGRTAERKAPIAGQIELFPQESLGSASPKPSFSLSTKPFPSIGTPLPPDQTNAKSKLIAEYIEKFQLVTKGGLYIDGFAGPQSRNHEEAWTARRVLEIVPPRLRTFWLCELEARGLSQLRELKSVHHGYPKSRRVIVLEGDFNKNVDLILKSGRFTRKAAVFALLDQRNTECHWSTVRSLAAYAGRTKIELLYFLGTSWLHRSLTQSIRPERKAEIDRWWGGQDWRALVDLPQVLVVQKVAQRFTDELKYKHVKAYPIYQREDGNRAAFHLIHASDHPQAPILMDRAYLKILGDTPDVDLGRQKQLFR